ncbi:MAG: ATP synthase F1 subunit delta [Planctomycetales bacterium]|nr:ATP synthase F1 subunit delta [Planctomycetales bacterium]
MTQRSATSGAARETVFDVDTEKLARVYAQAGLGAAGENAGELVKELKSLVSDVLDKHPQLEQVFDSALVPQEEKLGMLDRLFAGQLSTTALNLLKVLAKHGRLGQLRYVVRSASALWELQNNRVQVQVQTASELSHELQHELREMLGKALGCEPLVTTEINPDLIGGFVVRMGDKVFDASTRTNLERTRQAMIARAIETIQNQPSHFIDQSGQG